MTSVLSRFGRGTKRFSYTENGLARSCGEAATREMEAKCADTSARRHLFSDESSGDVLVMAMVRGCTSSKRWPVRDGSSNRANCKI